MHRLFLVLSLLACGFGTAGASEYEAPDIRLITDPGLVPTAGEMLYGNFEIQSPTGGTMTAPELRSALSETEVEGWTPVIFDLPQTINLTPGVPYYGAIGIICNDPTQPIFLDYTFEGTPHREVVFLLPALDWGVNTRTDLAGFVFPAAPTMARPEPFQPVISPLDASGDTGGRDKPTPAAQKETRRASGSFGYQRTGGWASADGITVVLYDQRPGLDLFLGSVVIGPDGTWAILFNWSQTEQPDLYVVYHLANSHIKISLPFANGNNNYQFTSSVKHNASSSNVTWSPQEPVNLQGRVVTHMITQFTRCWRYLDELGYGSIGPVVVEYPQSDWPHYNRASREIRIPMDGNWWWNDGMYWHEYGHHFMYEFGQTDSGGGYCQAGSRCDEFEDGALVCRHCGWCQENAAIAWSEGFPSFISDATGRQVDKVYAVYNGRAVDPANYETAKICSAANNGNDDYDNPALTEGALVALARDFEDYELFGEGDIDDRANGIGQDRMQLGVKALLDIAADLKPTSAWAFLNDVIAEHGAGQMQATWSTAYNNGFNIDTTPPGSVGGSVTSPSHPLFAESPDATVTYTWSTASDDISGIAGYSVWLGPAPAMPDATMDVGFVNTLTTGALLPGSYVFSIRAVDNAGNWSNSWSAYGPVVIRDPLPADFASVTNSNLPFQVTPSQFTQTLPVATPSVLYSTSNVYLNFQAHNSGDLATTGSPTVAVSVDGEVLHQEFILSALPLGGGGFRTWLNKGPYPVSPGRHTLTVLQDRSEVMPEANELNNIVAKQWVWRPISLAPPRTINLAPPPALLAGWEFAPPFSEYNCSGLRLNAAGTVYAGAVVRAVANIDDYDLRIHAASLSAQSGFQSGDAQAVSYRGAGQLDAVFVKRDNAFVDNWDLGVLNGNGLLRAGAVESDLVVEYVQSNQLATATTHNLTLAADQYLALHHFTLTRGASTPTEIVLEIDPAAGPVQVAQFNATSDHMGLLDYDSYAATDANGQASLDFSVPAGSHGIVVWRDPVDLPDGMAPALNYTLRIGTPRPDLAVYEPNGWAGPLVPRHTNDGIYTSVPIPTQLDGNLNSTYLNSAFRNLSTTAAGAVDNLISLDGEPLLMQQWPSVLANGTALWNVAAPVTVRGGRHILSMKLDPDEVQAEKFETNNVYGRQWIWSPLPLVVDQLVARPAPPNPVGGWEHVTDGAAHFNCDGFRTPLPVYAGDNGYWLAVAAMPGDSTDVDLRLYEAGEGTLDGFEHVRALSTWDVEMSDYVLLNFRATPRRVFDVGAIGVAGAAGFDAVTVASVHLGSDPAGDYGPYAMAAGEFLNLHEVYLTPGQIGISLTNVSGNIDWGLTLHRAAYPYDGKSPVNGATAWTQPAGATESFSYDVPQAGYYCVSVWKLGQSDLNLAGSYTLSFGDGVSAVGPLPALPQQTALTGVHPNPFNPQTTIEYEVRSAGPVSLDIHDLRGALVRRLVGRRMEAGAHAVVWNGTDEAGQSVASGVYVVRLKAREVESLRKLVLLE